LHSFGRMISELSPVNNAIPRLAYQIAFIRQRIKARSNDPEEGFSLVMPTRNRKEFLSCAITAVLSSTQAPFELIIMDNASSDGTQEMCQALEEQHPGIIRYVRLNRNFGTNSYALGFLRAKFKYLVDMDDDILAISNGWDRETIDAFNGFPQLGFLAMNVIQDKYTNGGKHEKSKYTERTAGGTTVEVGPTGGWFSVTTRPIYNDVGGFVFLPYKPFPAEDGKYVRRLATKGYFAGILKGSFVYHASGPIWNAAFGYKGTWVEKYRRHHKHLVPVIDEVDLSEPPSFQYAKDMVAYAPKS
jgi:glycosyltransferase involved in cell wall biosynthesis